MNKKIIKFEEIPELDVRNLMEVIGGEDYDEDCYVSQCTFSTSSCGPGGNSEQCYVWV